MNKLVLAIAATALATTASAQISNIELSERSARTLAMSFDAPNADSSCFVRLSPGNAPTQIHSEVPTWGPQSDSTSTRQQAFVNVPSSLWDQAKAVRIECTSNNGLVTAQTWVPAPPTVQVNLTGSHSEDVANITGGIMVQGQGAESFCWEEDFPILPGKPFLAETFATQDSFWDTYYNVTAQLSDFYHSYAVTKFSCSGKGGITETIIEMRMAPYGEVEVITYPATYR